MKKKEFIKKYNKKLKLEVHNNFVLFKYKTNQIKMPLALIKKNKKFFVKKKILKTFFLLLKKGFFNIFYGTYSKLTLKGVGFRISSFSDKKKFDNKLGLDLGYSNIMFLDYSDMNYMLKYNKNQLWLYGCNKQQLGNITAIIKKYKKPDNYKGKGIFLNNEKITLKPGKVRQK